MTITFKNPYDESITSQQANSLSEYSKIYSVDGKVKKKENYDEQCLSHVSYYLDPNENVLDIVSQLSSLNIKFSIIVKEYRNAYILEHISYYFEGLIISKSRYLYDSNSSLMGEEKIDISTSSPIYEQSRKYFYDFSKDDFFPMLTAYYNADGSLNYISYDSYRFDGQDKISFYEDGTSGIDDIDTLRNYLNFSNDQINYYLTASLDVLPI